MIQKITQIINNTNNFLLYVYLIDICNYNCSYCYNIFPRTNAKIDINALKLYISKLHARYGKDIDLNFIGGEPTMHPQLVDLCQQLHQLEYVHVTCFSNFSMPVDLYLKLLYNDVHLNLSWHSQNKEFFNKLNDTRLKELSNKITLLLMYEENADIDIFKAYDNIKNTYRDTHIQQLTCNNVYSEKSIKAFKNYIDNDQIDDFNNKIMCVVDGRKQLVSLYDIDYINNVADGKLFNYWLCNAGIECQYIHSDGKIYKCQSAYGYHDSIGSIYGICNFSKSPTICKYCTCNCELEVNKKKIFKK